ncbi:MAG TPA: type II secretion system protein GspG [Planctomycetota bacterium]|nr:type II secretion system protein GspG [Planctomycetota bacterium]
MQRVPAKALRSRSRIRPGFTLVELLVVITILALLASMITVAVMAALSSAHVSETQLKINTLSVALDEYQRKFGKYPDCSSDDPLESAKELYKNLKTPPKGVRYEFEEENFTCEDVDSSGEKAIVDAWKKPIWYMTASQYHFLPPNPKTFRLVSSGPDGSFDDTDDDNIFNWKFDEKEESPNHKKQMR